MLSASISATVDGGATVSGKLEWRQIFGPFLTLLGHSPVGRTAHSRFGHSASRIQEAGAEGRAKN